jgi:ATP-dependent Clp protease ATP-binding subunit ClpB
MEAKVTDLLRRQFRPEFLNRIDETIIFHSLSRAQIAQIVDIQLDHVRKYLAERKITLTLTKDAKELLAGAGYDPAFGARPLKRVIQHRILDALATELLAGKISDGDAVTADVDPKRRAELKFTAARG